MSDECERAFKHDIGELEQGSDFDAYRAYRAGWLRRGERDAVLMKCYNRCTSEQTAAAIRGLDEDKP